MKTRFISLLITLACIPLFLSSCSQQPSAREAFVRSYLERYPEATLQDIYKGSFQDVFGPAHILTNREAVIRYINHEIKSAEKFEEADYIPCGWQGNFLQVNLRSSLTDVFHWIPLSMLSWAVPTVLTPPLPKLL